MSQISDEQCRVIALCGTTYNPAIGHYRDDSRVTSVSCDKCKAKNLLVCRGIPGENQDLCVPCVDWFRANPPKSAPVTPAVVTQNPPLSRYVAPQRTQTAQRNTSVIYPVVIETVYRNEWRPPTYITSRSAGPALTHVLTPSGPIRVLEHERFGALGYPF